MNQGWLLRVVSGRRALNRPAILLAGLTLLGFGLRLCQAGSKGLWADEIFTALFASPDHDVAAVVREALSTPIPSPPLWFLVTHLFLKLLGVGDLVVRLPSIIAGTLAVPVIYLAGAELFDRRIGLLSATLLAVSPLHVHHSQEARFYAGVVLFSLLSLVFFYRGVKRPQMRWWGGFAVVTLINLYLHLTAFLVLFSLVAVAGIMLVADRPRPGGGRFALPMLASLAVILLGYAPMIPHLLSGALGPRGLGNAEEIEGLVLSFQGFLSLFGGFGAGAGLSLSLYLSASLWGLADAWRAQTRRRQAGLLLGWMVAPFLLILAFRPRHWFAAKYVISILPVFLIAVSLGLVNLAGSVARALSGLKLDGARWRRLRSAGSLSGWMLTALLLLYSLLAVAALPSVYAWHNDPWKRIGALLNANVQPGDAVIVVPFNPAILTMPAVDTMSYYGPTPQQVDVVDAAAGVSLETVADTHRRLWVVIERNADPERAWEVRAWLGDDPAVELYLGNGTKVLYTERQVSTKGELLDRALHLTLPLDEAYHSIAEACLDIGRWGDAQEAYRRAMGLEPGEAIWRLYLQASALQATGDAEGALEQYRQAIRLYPERWEARVSAGNCLRRMGRLDEAIEVYRQAVAPYQDPECASSPTDDVRVVCETIDWLVQQRAAEGS